eukprot:g11839.t1
MLFFKILATIILAASLMTSVFAEWDSTPAVIINPQRLATSTTTTAAVNELIRSRYPDAASPSRDDVDKMAAHAAKDIYTLQSALLASSGGAPPTYAAAVLLSTLQAAESSCPMEDMSANKKPTNAKTKKTKTADAADTNNDTGGDTDCDAEHEQCLASCTSHAWGGVFGFRGQPPAPGTCALVCTVVREGCSRCNRKRALHAAKAGGLVPYIFAHIRISSLELVKNFAQMVVRVAVLLWTFANKQGAIVWVLATLVGWTQTFLFCSLQNYRKARDDCVAETVQRFLRKRIMLRDVRLGAAEHQIRRKRKKRILRGAVAAMHKAAEGRRDDRADERRRGGGGEQEEDINGNEGDRGRGRHNTTAVSIGCNTEGTGLGQIVGGFVTAQVERVWPPSFLPK